MKNKLAQCLNGISFRTFFGWKENVKALGKMLKFYIICYAAIYILGLMTGAMIANEESDLIRLVIQGGVILVSVLIAWTFSYSKMVWHDIPTKSNE